MIPGSFIPAVEKGVREAMQHGVLAGYPVKGVRIRLVDGQHHSVDSSEIAFKLAGVQAMKQALELAEPVLLEPIMLVTLSVPEAHVGDVIGDLNSRRGRPQGMEPIGSMTEIKAEVPMAEMLTYAPDLRSITAGQGDYTLEFLRYEELPGHLAQKVVEQAGEAHAPAHAGKTAAPIWQPARSSHPSPMSPASSARAGCCGASSTRCSSPTAASAPSASCARPAPPTPAGCGHVTARRRSGR